MSLDHQKPPAGTVSTANHICRPSSQCALLTLPARAELCVRPSCTGAASRSGSAAGPWHVCDPRGLSGTERLMPSEAQSTSRSKRSTTYPTEGSSSAETWGSRRTYDPLVLCLYMPIHSSVTRRVLQRLRVLKTESEEDPKSLAGGPLQGEAAEEGQQAGRGAVVWRLLGGWACGGGVFSAAERELQAEHVGLAGLASAQHLHLYSVHSPITSTTMCISLKLYNRLSHAELEVRMCKPSTDCPLPGNHGAVWCTCSLDLVAVNRWQRFTLVEQNDPPESAP